MKLTAFGLCRHKLKTGKLVKKIFTDTIISLLVFNPSLCQKLAKKATLFTIISISKYLTINNFITNNNLTFIL